VNRRDEVPNKELARALAATQDLAGIAEIAGHLRDKHKSVASDCIGVLYHIGYSKPELIQGYTADFLDLLHSRENRMVWGGMIALATIAGIQAPAIWSRLDEVIAAVDHGTLITGVWGVKTLARVAAYCSRSSGLAFHATSPCTRRASCRPWTTPIAASSWTSWRPGNPS
jgi:hypothetical protein